MNKKAAKQNAKKCYLCEETDRNTFDVHRIHPGCEGGKYTKYNTVICCATCHRKIHGGTIKIHRWYYSTAGMVLHCEIDGEELFI